MKEKKFEKAISQYKTPFYFFDTDILADQIKKIRTAIGTDVELCYAMKANPFLIKDLEELIDSFEVCSPGEFHICERAAIRMDKIVMSGVYKNEDDLHYALKEYGNQILYTVESLSHWNILEAYANSQQLPIKVLLRLTSGNQFGMDETLLRQIIKETMDKPKGHSYIDIEGIQFFSGTQKKVSEKLKKELAMLDKLCLAMEEEYGFTVKKLEYGPGLPICYFEEEQNEEDAMLSSLAEALRVMAYNGKISLEMGRFIAAPCGFFVTSIVDTKNNKGQNYCIVDGGMHHINYYGQMLAMKKPPILHWNQEDGDLKEWTVCGSLCTVNDVLVKQYPFHGLVTGDKLIFEKTGAYSVTEGISLFLSRELPQVLLYSEKDNLRQARGNYPTDVLNYFLQP